jgi:Arc/MetJ-type ribon-helix-helix transcriptional regulator
MATMTIDLTEKQAGQLHELVAEGRFSSPDEAVKQLLSQVLEEQQAVPYTPEVLAELREGMAEADRGEFVSQQEIKTFFDDWKRNG